MHLSCLLINVLLLKFYSWINELCSDVPGHSSVNYQPQETRSRMSKTVEQALQDNVAIPHFMHFMELRGADHLVRFWLEAERFRSTSWSRVRAHSLNSVKHSSLAEPVPASPDGSELSELTQKKPNVLARHSNSEGCTVQTQQRDSSSTEAGARPNTPRTATPSRQPPSRSGTPLKVQSSSTLRDLSDTLMKSESPLNTFLSLHLLSCLQVFNFLCGFYILTGEIIYYFDGQPITFQYTEKSS